MFFLNKNSFTITRIGLYYYAFAVNLGVAFVSIAKILIAFIFIYNIILSFTYSNIYFYKKFISSILCCSIIIGLLWMNITAFWSIANYDEIIIAFRRYDRLLILPMLYLLINDNRTIFNIIRIIVLMQIFILFSSFLMLLGFNLPWAMPYIAVHFFNENSISFNHKLGILYTSTLEQPIMSVLLFLLLIQFRKLFNFLKSNILFILLLLLIFINVFYFMIGRSAYIGMLIVVSLLIYYKLPIKLKKYSIFIPIIFIIILFISSSKFNSRLLDSYTVIKEFKLNDNNTVIGDRLDFTRNSFKTIIHNPILGVGLGGWKQSYLSFDGREFNPPSNPHNQYLLWFCEGGVIGLLFLLLILFSLFKEGLKLNKKYKELIFIITILISVLFLFTCLFFGAVLSDFFFIIIASVLNLNYNKINKFIK